MIYVRPEPAPAGVRFALTAASIIPGNRVYFALETIINRVGSLVFLNETGDTYPSASDDDIDGKLISVIMLNGRLFMAHGRIDHRLIRSGKKKVLWFRERCLIFT